VATRTAGTGGYAEQALAAVDGLIPVPDGMSLSDAAALMHDGVTALGLFGDAAVRAASRR
ncbi:MAG: NADPH:quinone reductase, partial [Thermocrispum sp.]